MLKFYSIVDLAGSSCLGVVSEYCKDGNCAAHLARPLSSAHYLLEMKQLANTLCSLHKLGIMHGDIKPNNILLHEGDLLFADIALPSFAPKLRLRDTPGAYHYFAPEYWEGGLCLASDVWSLGLIYLEMYHRKGMRELEGL